MPRSSVKPPPGGDAGGVAIAEGPAKSINQRASSAPEQSETPLGNALLSERRRLFEAAEMVLVEWHRTGTDPDRAAMSVLLSCYQTRANVDAERRRVAGLETRLKFAGRRKLEAADAEADAAQHEYDAKLPRIESELARLQQERNQIVARRESAIVARARIIDARRLIMEDSPTLVRDQVQRAVQRIEESNLGRRRRELQTELDFLTGVLAMNPGAGRRVVDHLDACRQSRGEDWVPSAERGIVAFFEWEPYIRRRAEQKAAVEVELAAVNKEYNAAIEEAERPLLAEWDKN